MSSQPIVYVEGFEGFGLGNCLFQIVAALYYVEKYGYRLVIDDSSESMNIGTANVFGKTKLAVIDGYYVPYKYTLLSKLHFEHLDIPRNVVFNNDTGTVVDPKGKDLIVEGFNQNSKLYWECKDGWLKHFNFEHPEFLKRAGKFFTEVDNDENNVLLCFRRGCDYMCVASKIQKEQYDKALNLLFANTGRKNYNYYIISDIMDDYVKEVIERLKGKVYMCIEEDDVTQMYIGMRCTNFIITSSTFHYWIAVFSYLKHFKANVYMVDKFNYGHIDIPEIGFKMVQ